MSSLELTNRASGSSEAGSGPPPGFPAKPISFAQAALKPAAPAKPISFAQAALKPAVPESDRDAGNPPQTSATSGATPNENLRLKRYPKDRDPNLLRSYLEAELRNKEHEALFTEISQDSKTEKRLILMRGASGSGKSLLATLLACVTSDGVIFSADNFFLDRKGRYQFNPNDLSKAHETCREQCLKAMVVSKTPVIIDNTNTMTWEMIPYAKMAVQYGYSIHIVEPTTPWKSNARLLAQKNSHGVPLDKIKSMLSRYDRGITPEILLRQIGVKQNAKDSDLESAMKNLALK
jgi:predicted kinase